MRVDKKLQWVHVFCNASYTVLKVNSRRGWQAMEEIGLIPNYHGIIIHDCWSPYWKHPDEITHSICCAHLLRELTGVEENNPSYTWPKAFKDLLLEMKKKRDQEAENGGGELDPVEIERFSQRYDSIIKTAYEETPPPKVDPNKKKGRKKRGKVLALVDRLTAYKESVCLFVKNFAVQFDNNQAERDLRMTKAKSKISGCFRTIEGAQDYLNIMSYVSTAKKQGYNAYEAIKNAVSDDPFFIFQ
jgi:transposase